MESNKIIHAYNIENYDCIKMDYNDLTLTVVSSTGEERIRTLQSTYSYEDWLSILKEGCNNYRLCNSMEEAKECVKWAKIK